MSEGGFIKGIIVPGLPQPLLAPEQNEGWGRIKARLKRRARKLKRPILMSSWFTVPCGQV